MHAGANWISLFGQKAQILFRQRVREWLQILRPAPAVFVIPTVQLLASFSSQAQP